MAERRGLSLQDVANVCEKVLKGGLEMAGVLIASDLCIFSNPLFPCVSAGCLVISSTGEQLSRVRCYANGISPSRRGGWMSAAWLKPPTSLYCFLINLKYTSASFQWLCMIPRVSLLFLLFFHNKLNPCMLSHP